MKKLIVGLIVLSLVTVLVVACGGSGGGSTDVHMGNTTFVQSSVTISKGSSLNLIDDVAVTHIIGNGSWVNGAPVPASEPGAPTVNNLQFTSEQLAVHLRRSKSNDRAIQHGRYIPFVL